MKIKLLPLLLFLCIHLSISHAQTRQADSLALVGIYQSMGGSQWTIPWDLNQPMTTWHGVSLNTQGRVEQLACFYNGLTGNLPTQLNLPALISLEFRGQGITGTLPDFMGMPQLTHLDVSDTQLSGPLPDFNHLPKLLSFILQGSAISGAIPDFSNLPDLVSLIMDGNLLGGNVPNFSNLPQLSALSLDRNGLGGNIPDFSALPRLKFLRLSNNKLSGAIPNFSAIPLLETLWLHSNQLTGSIPNFTTLPVLRVLKVSQNRLSGSIPNFRNVARLQDIWLDENQLTGSIPNFTNLTMAKILDLSGNQLTGSIPDFNLTPLLLDLIVDDNQLSGTIPELTNCPDLEKVHVGNNQLEGRVPLFSASPNLEELFLTGNAFTFEDMFPNYNALYQKITTNGVGIGYSFRYIDQDSVGQAQTIALPIGANHTLDVGVDVGVSSNIYYWYKDGVFLDSVIGSSQYVLTNFQAIDVGNYQVQITNTRVTNPTETNQNLRLYSKTISLDVGTAVTTLPTGILVVYPNPTTHTIQIELPDLEEEKELQLINALGQVLYQETLITTNSLYQLDLSSQAAGWYWLRIASPTGRVWQTSLLKQ